MIIVTGGKAVGVKVRGANPKKPWSIIKASKGVVSNASVWDTQSLLPNQDITPKQRDWSSEARQTPQTGSFMHLHLGELLYIYQLFLVTLRHNFKLTIYIYTYMSTLCLTLVYSTLYMLIFFFILVCIAIFLYCMQLIPFIQFKIFNCP